MVNRPFTSASTCAGVEENPPGREICSENLQVFFLLSQNRKELKTMIGFGGQTRLTGRHLYQAFTTAAKKGSFFPLKSAADGTEGLMWEVG